MTRKKKKGITFSESMSATLKLVKLFMLVLMVKKLLKYG